MKDFIHFFKEKLTPSFVQFLFVGGIATILDITLYSVFYKGVHMPAPLAGSLSFGISAFINFSLNDSITFTAHTKSYWNKLTTFYSIAAGGLCINYFLIELLTHVGTQFFQAKIIVIFFVLIYNYLLHSKITFRKN